MEEIIQDCKQALGENLLSIIKYGSEGQKTGLMLVTKTLDFAHLERLRPIVKQLVRDNIMPMLTTKEELVRSCDVFPLELIDIISPHQVLYGEDVLAKLKFQRAELRREIEFELRGKLIHLRTGYVTATTDKELRNLLQSTVPAFMPLLYGLLYIKKLPMPVMIHELTSSVEQAYKVDLGIMHRIRRNEVKDMQQAVKDLLAVLETLINIVDTLKTR